MTMSTLRVAHVMNGIGLGGVPPIVLQLMAALPRHRYELTVYCIKRHSDSSPGRAARLREFEAAGLPVRFPDGKETPLETIGRLCDWLEEDHIDILHTHSYQPNLLARMAGALSGRRDLRIVAHYHNFYDDKWTADGTLPLDRCLARSTDALIACSDAVRSHMVERLQLPPDSIHLIQNGVDCDRFSAAHDTASLRKSLGIPPGTRVVASVGRISRQKASDDVVRAARTICETRGDCVFVMAGADDDPFTPTVRRMVSDLALGERVIFTGHLSDVAPLYALADVVVMPSRWEGFGLVLVEAMAAGTPIVTTRVGPIPEVVGEHAALLIPADSAADLAAAIGRLLDDPSLAAQLASNGKARARMFSWSRAAAQLEALYAQVA
jgi:glycosyltransferase involved in cell wall biosynthesis